MRERERLLHRVSQLLALIARPYNCDALIPTEVQTNLWQLGVPCNELTPREFLVAQLWARKRSLETSLVPLWGGPGATPPTAA
ncbi:MAG TPA: hypothetical protein VJT78_07115 [Candidatus Dormibacteraeota bacterium]|nr:hypothetical protein [Candidatus Dormibacteraeota bacterium]